MSQSQGGPSSGFLDMMRTSLGLDGPGVPHDHDHAEPRDIHDSHHVEGSRCLQCGMLDSWPGIEGPCIATDKSQVATISSLDLHLAFTRELGRFLAQWKGDESMPLDLWVAEFWEWWRTQ